MNVEYVLKQLSANLSINEGYLRVIPLTPKQTTDIKIQNLPNDTRYVYIFK